MKTKLAWLLLFPVLASGADWFEQQGARVERDARGNIVTVDLTGVWVSDADLERLSGLANLNRLVLAHTRVTDAGFAHLAALKNVRELDCYYAEFFTADALAHLSEWQSLERLVLRGTRVTSKALEHLAKLKSLRTLDLGYSQIDDANLDLLAELPRLDTLALGGNRISAAGLAQLRLLKSLRHLDLAGVQRVDSGEWGIVLNPATLGEIGGLTALRELDLTDNVITQLPDGIGGMAQLRRFSLRNNQLTALPESIGSLRELTHLDLRANHLTVLPAVIATLPKLEKLDLRWCRLASVSAWIGELRARGCVVYL